MKVLALCWHPARSNIQSAGGFKRFYEVLKFTNIEVVVIDKYPSIYKRLRRSNIRIFEYGKSLDPTILDEIVPYLLPILDRLISTILLLACSIRIAWKERKNGFIVYVPFSELSHVTLSGVLLKRIFNFRLVLCNLNVNVFKLEKFINCHLHSQADDIIAISRSLKSDLAKRGIFATQINGVGFDISPYKRVHSKKKIYDCVFVGRHTKEKGFFDLLTIWKLLLHSFRSPFSLVTIGDFPRLLIPEISGKIRDYKLEKSIKILGNLSEEKKLEVFSLSKICVFPSYFEGWGIVPMEALALGLPVITYDLPVYKESIGECGALVKVKKGDIASFARKIIFVQRNLDKYRKLAAMWKPRLSWKKVAEKEWGIICNGSKI